MQEFRCKKCGKLLAKENMINGEFTIKCYNCNTFNDLKIVTVDKYESNVYHSINNL